MKQSRLRLRKLKLSQKPKKKKSSSKRFLILGIFVFIILVLGTVFFILPNSWNGSSKISLAIKKGDGGGAVIVLDPQTSSITTLEIPKDTLVFAANQLGSWKLSSIAKLGVDQALDGSFFKNTIIKSFKFPVDSWGGDSLLELISGNLFQKISSLISSDPTDLSFLDRVRIILYSVSVTNNGKTNINLKDTSFLKRTKLPDASLGWQIGESIPTSLQSYFTNTTIQDENLNVVIENATGDSEEVDVVSFSIETLGANIASIQTLPKADTDCTVKGLSQPAVTKIGKILSCKTIFQKGSNNFDIEINLGVKFKERF